MLCGIAVSLAVIVHCEVDKELNIRENEWYSNSKGKKRYVIQKDYDIMTHRTRVVYVKKSLYEPVKSCYIEQFIKWVNS